MFSIDVYVSKITMNNYELNNLSCNNMNGRNANGYFDSNIFKHDFVMEHRSGTGVVNNG